MEGRLTILDPLSEDLKRHDQILSTCGSIKHLKIGVIINQSTNNPFVPFISIISFYILTLVDP